MPLERQTYWKETPLCLRYVEETWSLDWKVVNLRKFSKSVNEIFGCKHFCEYGINVIYYSEWKLDSIIWWCALLFIVICLPILMCVQCYLFTGLMHVNYFYLLVDASVQLSNNQLDVWAWFGGTIITG